MDELGRGTSTFDGVAIAYATRPTNRAAGRPGCSELRCLRYAVAKTLANEVHCRSVFSTHYHTLMGDFKADPTIGVHHMGLMADGGPPPPPPPPPFDELWQIQQPWRWRIRQPWLLSCSLPWSG